MQPQSAQVKKLRLDPENPRLPASIQGQGQTALFEHLYETGVLSELVDSFIDNGYFSTEPLLVIEGEDSRLTVIEGNRRLAALLWMLQISPGDAIPLDRDIPAGAADRVREVPVVLVENRESISTYLGYRHISGLKPWSPEAKARFIADEVDQKARTQEGNPFSTVGRSFGSNATGMRNSYLAYRVLEHGRNEYQIKISHVLNERFGVWTRCLNSRDIRQFLNLGAPLSYSDVRAAIENLNGAHLRDVIEDLTPSNGTPPLLSDSRDITHYGQVLSSPEALKVLRSTRSLGAAKVLILDVELATRLFRMAEQAKGLLGEILELEESSADLRQAADQLWRSTKQIRTILADLESEED